MKEEQESIARKSERKYFKGTIVITDPCYIDTKDDKMWSADPNTFDLHTGEGLNNFGFTNYLYKETVVGDWDCTTYELLAPNKRKKIGAFCADAGLVGVFYLNEILKFNPEYDYKNDKKHGLATIIKDFDGTIKYARKQCNKNNSETSYLQGDGNILFITKENGI